MPEINYGSVPGGYALTTSGVGGGAGGGGLLDFFREMARRRAVSQPRGRRAAFESAEGPMAVSDGGGSGGGGAVASAPAPAIEHPWYTLQGAATRPVGLGAQMIPGMMADPRLLPPSMRPDAAHVNFSPGTIATARNNALNEDDFSAQVGADRARTANMTGEVGGAAAGTPGGAVVPRGTAPMLTPSNAAVQPRILSQEERRRQQMSNSLYGR